MNFKCHFRKLTILTIRIETLEIFPSERIDGSSNVNEIDSEKEETNMNEQTNQQE